MPTDKNDLKARLASATPQDTARGLVFNAIFDTLHEHGGEEAARACDPAGKGHRTDFFSYPIADFLNIAFAAADRLEAKLGSTERAFFEIGYRSASNVFSSMLGATLVALAGRGDARSLLTSTSAGYRATVSYGERTLDWVGPKHARFTFKRDFLVPAFHCGVFTGAVEAMSVKNVRAVGKQTAPLEAVYDVTWD